MLRKCIRKVQSKYSHNHLINALDAIKHEKISPILAVNRYETPSSTIYNRLSGRFKDFKDGTKVILSKEEEGFVVHAIRTFQQ